MIDLNLSRRAVLKNVGLGAISAGAVASFQEAIAQTAGNVSWPQKPVRFIVPFVPGGTSDIVSRTTANEMTKFLPHPVVIENKAGGGGVPAMQEVARSAGDGHTLIMGHVGSMAVNPLIFQNTGYDVNKDFVPVTLLAKVPSLFVIHPDVPAKNFTEFVAYVKRNPGKLNYGSAGGGTSHHLAGELFKSMSGIYMVHFPYKGSGPAMLDLLGGSMDVMFDNLPSAIPHIKSGKLKALAVSSNQRSEAVPDLPTLEEAGGPALKGYEASSWFGLLAPAGTPVSVVNRIQQEVAKAMGTAVVKEKLLSQGAIPGGNTPDEFVKFIDAEHKKWAQVVKTSGAKVD